MLIPLEGATDYINPENGFLVLRYGGTQMYFKLAPDEVAVLLALKAGYDRSAEEQKREREHTEPGRRAAAAKRSIGVAAGIR